MKKPLLMASVIIASAAFAVAPAASARDNELGAAAIGFALGVILAPPAVVYQPQPNVVYGYAAPPPPYGYYSYPAPPRVYFHYGDNWRGRRIRHWHHDHDHWERDWHRRYHDHR